MTARALYDDHGNLVGLGDDDHTQYLLLAGRSGGQIAFGGTVAGNILDLQGADAAPDTGIVRINSPVTNAYDTISNTTPAQAFCNTWNPTATITGAYIGGYLSVGYTFTVSTGVYIPATFSDTGISAIAATPGFSAYTFINQLHTIRNSGNFNLPSGLVMNIGLTHERNTSGTSTTAGTTGISFSPQTRTTVSGAIMTKTDQTAVRCSPTFSTVAGSTVNLGTIRGVHCFNPAVALFQPQAGVEAMTAYVGLDVNSITFGGNVTKAAVRSAITAASNSYFLLNTGGAQSDFGNSPILNASLVQVSNDSFGLSLGAGGGDVQVLWNGSALEFDPIIGDDMRISFATDIHTIVSASTNEDSAINFNYPKGAFGEGGAPGNNKWRFVANAETVTIGGDFSQFLMTQAANDTINVGLGLYAGWTINTPTPTIGTGSITTVAGLNVGGNANVGTNRVGLRIISNPSGGGGINAALWVTAGLSRFDGRVDVNNGIALGGGAAATLGTIGGSGPTAAAQAQWVEIDVGGVAHWIPAWT
ncbi:MAG: hypothetical protein ACR2RF_09965 [Geminicoccaceae bacterium]